MELALIGFGSQGRNLADSAAQTPGVRIRALCDIWPYRLQYGANRMKDYRQHVNAYADYRAMLEKEKGLDAVVIATPDFVHAEQANACLAAGLHVYCESMMADSIDAARSMIRAARKASRLLQIGYQRRSHPGYRHVVEKLLAGGELLERIVQVQTRWALGVSEPKGWPKPQALAEAVLKKYGYPQMQQFRNWTFLRQVRRRPGGRTDGPPDRCRQLVPRAASPIRCWRPAGSISTRRRRRSTT